MDDQSPKKQTAADETPAADEKSASMWKKEVSLKRKSKADAVEGDAVADTPAEQPAVEEPKIEEPVAEEPVAAEPEVAEETLWKKEVSFGRKNEAVEAEPLVAARGTRPVPSAVRARCEKKRDITTPSRNSPRRGSGRSPFARAIASSG